MKLLHLQQFSIKVSLLILMGVILLLMRDCNSNVQTTRIRFCPRPDESNHALFENKFYYAAYWDEDSTGLFHN